ncbi:PREDICTED: uncharacterized protein LOC104827311 [Tarenaya hassleriana]|uniref:uncharacterized protein LOC104827311 n=1 Tax=Tarenaya hassleriana TaxID=28532 RepID=UPI00053C3E53|nr:PREDICTED: uncharacterized protein LOC104827311 [Tarenaya hassleriana]XP_010558776.1 PREDICTED: uncharacterized protein LOC104827311 [Tarenaya hassleriana]
MAITPLRLTNPFPSPRHLPATIKLRHNHYQRPFTLFATDVESSTVETQPDPDQFESRLSKIRLRYRSGTGKKAEVRKSKRGTTGSANKGSGMYLPPVDLKESMSGGLKVELGFSPYSERVNGGIAGLGLAALLLVELATGKSVLNYHTSAIVLIQIYFVAAVSALFIKYEKEKASVWPKD